ncbi:hypothetical protein DDZ15_01545 [Rhodohalobacter mucosus]|uniref:Phosphate/sulfate permease n=1 Tax=Rhodohalobacter mucosus TaxID=2079485 RepID=A0A316TYW3_9BACT|nr:hypothetical protein DDZ15_01545 [Rhodohalobacter mucosus]
MAGKKNQGFLRGIFPVSLIALIRSERRFLLMIGLFFIVAGLTYQTPQIAMWIGFFFAAYSAIANDSIQTIGTFLASNAKTSWWILWLFIGGIFVITVSYSWIVYDGDVSYQRLTSKGFSEAPDEFKFLQVAAPLFLLILTRLRMPVSTTFLLLSAFATTPEGIVQMLTKSVSGYLVAFIVAIVVWLSLNRLMVKWFKGNPHPVWRPLQWVISGALWAVWLMQDAANIAVYLPRSLSVNGFLMFTGFVFFGLGLLFYLRGDKIQRIVTEKSDVADVRSATVIDGVYAVILWYFKTISVVPMSTTWVFIGLLAGREIAMSITDMGGKGRPYRHTYRLIVKDLTYAIIGLIISIALAIAINPVILDELLKVISG